MKKCPLLKKACIEGECMFWVHMLGTHPQSGHPVDQFDCSMRWLPILLVENARHSRGVQAAVESARNEITSRQDTLNSAVKVAQRGSSQVEATEQDRIAGG